MLAPAPRIHEDGRASLASDRVVLESPTSYAGSAKRIWKLAKYKTGGAKVALGLVCAVLILFAWTFVTAWYLTSGPWVVPYRLIRRSGRKRKMESLRHRELMEAVRGS